MLLYYYNMLYHYTLRNCRFKVDLISVELLCHKALETAQYTIRTTKRVTKLNYHNA